MRANPRGWGLLAPLVASLLFCLPEGPASAAPREVGPELDFGFYRARVAPILHERCAACHADPGKRTGRWRLKPAWKQRVLAVHHRSNFKAVLRFVTPGNARESALLQESTGQEHEGGRIFNAIDRELGTLIDFVNGARLPPPNFEPPPRREGEPDFSFYVRWIAPVLANVCSECHAGRGQRRFRLRTAAEGTRLSPFDHLANYDTVMALVNRRQPLKSQFLLKPLAIADGGAQHKGGDRMRAGDPRHQVWLAFLRGEPGPPLSTPSWPVEQVELQASGLRLEAEGLVLAGDIGPRPDAHASGHALLRPGPQGGIAETTLLVRDAGVYEIVLDTEPGLLSYTLSLGESIVSRVDPVLPGETQDRFAPAGPAHLCDGQSPLIDASGGLTLEAPAIEMVGSITEPAAFLSPADVEHDAIEAVVRLPPESEGGRDAILLLDAASTNSARCLALLDGGRRLGLGVLERGVLRVVQTEPVPDSLRRSPRFTLRAEVSGGVLVGSVNGRPLAVAAVSDGAFEGLFGVRTHGVLGVEALRARKDYVVHECAFDRAPVVELPLGSVRLRIALPAGAGAVDAILLRSLGP